MYLVFPSEMSRKLDLLRITYNSTVNEMHYFSLFYEVRNAKFLHVHEHEMSELLTVKSYTCMFVYMLI